MNEPFYCLSITGHYASDYFSLICAGVCENMWIDLSSLTQTDYR